MMHCRCNLLETECDYPNCHNGRKDKKIEEVILSDWIPVSTPPTIEGVYETKDYNEVTGYQRYKNGIWGAYHNHLEPYAVMYPADGPHGETAYPPTHWRGILETTKECT